MLVKRGVLRNLPGPTAAGCPSSERLISAVYRTERYFQALVCFCLAYVTATPLRFSVLLPSMGSLVLRR